MSTVLPLAVDGELTGSAFAIGTHEEDLLLATTLHLLGEGNNIQIGLPKHGGDCSKRQSYPVQQFPAFEAEIESTNSLADLAILRSDTEGLEGAVSTCRIPEEPDLIGVGDKVVVLGYPFSPIGSTLETWTPTHVSALGSRKVGPGASVEEIVLSMQGHPGISGSPVIGRQDGILHGIVRGVLSAPEVIDAGGIPIGTDTSVTFAVSGHLLTDLIPT
jgi:hypothetical protein